MMANIENVCPFFPFFLVPEDEGQKKGKTHEKLEWKEKKIHFHFKKMDFVSNYLLVCTLHVINGRVEPKMMMMMKKCLRLSPSQGGLRLYIKGAEKRRKIEL